MTPRLRPALLALAAGMTFVVSCVACSPSPDDTTELTDSVPLPTEAVPVVDDVAERTGDIALGVRPLTDPDQTVDEALEATEATAGRQVAVVRLDYHWDDPFPDRSAIRVADQGKRLHVHIETRRTDGTPVLWADAAETDSGPLWAERQLWINSLGAFEGELDVTVAAAPTRETGMGSAEDFVALWRRFARDLKAQNDTISMTWVMGADESQVDDWYPGDDTVDKVGAEIENAFGCRGDDEAWVGPQQSLSPLLVLGGRHPGKELVIASVGTVEDPSAPNRKASWIEGLAFALEGAGFQQVSTVTFADGVSATDPGCDWSLDSSQAAEDAFGTVATFEHLGGASAAPATVRCPIRQQIEANPDDTAVADTDGDGSPDLVFGASDRAVGVGEQGAEGRDQRVLFRFPAVDVNFGASERVELRVRLVEPGPVNVGGVRLVALRDPSHGDEQAFAAPSQVVDEMLIGDGAAPGWYVIDVTEHVVLRDATLFRLEVSEPQDANGVLSAWTFAMADAIAVADRPTLVVRGC